MVQLPWVQQFTIWILPVLFAITLHEAAHGFVAHRLGDDTAYQLGRVSANPLKHIDLLGTIIVPLFLLATTHFAFGWAKPVPVRARKLRRPKRDLALVALAGPLANLLMAFAWMCLFKGTTWFLQAGSAPSLPLLYLIYMSQAGVLINGILMVLNLLPIPPLDGSRFVSALLAAPWDRHYDNFSAYGFLILLVMALLGWLNALLSPPLNAFIHFLHWIFQVQ